MISLTSPLGSSNRVLFVHTRTVCARPPQPGVKLDLTVRAARPSHGALVTQASVGTPWLKDGRSSANPWNYEANSACGFPGSGEGRDPAGLGGSSNVQASVRCWPWAEA